MDWPLLATLVGLCVVAAFLRDWRMAGTASILLADWTACTLYVAKTFDPAATGLALYLGAYPWPVFGVIDYAAGYCVIRMLPKPVSRWQVAIGITYAWELVCHANVGIHVILHNSPQASLYDGKTFLHRAAWGQAAIIGLWIGYELARRHRMLDRRPSARAGLLGRRLPFFLRTKR